MSTSAFSNLVAVLGNYTSWIVPFLFTLTVIVFFHELGHFLVARFLGIRVLVFSIGFGPEWIGFTDRHATRWKISAVPLGGYVKFFGDDNEASCGIPPSWPRCPRRSAGTASSASRPSGGGRGRRSAH